MGACSGSILDQAPGKDRIDEGDTSYYCEYKGAGPWFRQNPTDVMPQRMAQDGPGASEPMTIPQLFDKAVEANGDEDALSVERPTPEHKQGEKPPPALPIEDWTKWTFEEYQNDVRAAAMAMIKLGFRTEESVNVWGFNSPEWCMSAMAAAHAGGKVAGLYPTDGDDTVAYKVVHSAGSIVVVDGEGKVDRLVKALNARRDAKRIRAIVIWGDKQPTAARTIAITGCANVQLMGWDKFVEMGRDSKLEDELDRRIAALKPGSPAALIYTSGTTGEPKAVMLSHDNIIFECTAVMGLIQKSTGFTTCGQERVLSYLPMSHVAGMMVDVVSPIYNTRDEVGWETTFFARPYDLKAGSFSDRLKAVKPTVFLGVPLVWEKVADKIRAIGAEVTGAKKQIATMAKEKGLAYAKNCQLGKSGCYPAGYQIAEALVLKKIKANLGLEELKFGFTGAAPIRVDTLEYFGSLGISINEVYGMSECSGACTGSVHEAHEWGSCGFELPGVEVRIFKCDEQDLNKKTPVEYAPDIDEQSEEYMGEICYRGRNIMMGYMACPDWGPDHHAEIAKKNRDAIDAEGWLHSGDKGLISEAGMCKITGRYKELIIGEGGENIAPVPIEDHVKKTCDGIQEIVMIGDKRKYNVALVTLKAEGANGESPGTDNLDAGAKRLNKAVTTISGAMKDDMWIKAITDAITSANTNTKVCHNATFKIQKFCILPSNFSEEKGELTPTKKIKRKVIENKYMELLNRMYQTDGTYIPYSS